MTASTSTQYALNFSDSRAFHGMHDAQQDIILSSNSVCLKFFGFDSFPRLQGGSQYRIY